MNPKNKSREQAIKNGDRTYQSKPCKRCGDTLRYVKGWSCVPCASKRTIENPWRLANPEGYAKAKLDLINERKLARELNPRQPTLRQIAKEKGEKFYHNKSCKKCGSTLKRTSTTQCVPCESEKQKSKEYKEWRAQFRKKKSYKEYQSKWRKESGSNAYHNVKRRRQLQHDLKELSNEEKKQIRQIYRQAGEKGRDYEVDHIIPLYKGGRHHPDNLQILHISEHRIKSAEDTRKLRTRNSN